MKNYLNWCSVVVGNGAAFTEDVHVECVAAGAVDLAATPLTGFQLGSTPWHGTDGDHGSGERGTVTGTTSSTRKTVTAGTSCVWVCCEFNGGGGCPTANQCP